MARVESSNFVLELIIYLLCFLVLFLALPLLSQAETVPQGCYRTTDNLWSCYQPADGSDYRDMGSPILNSIQYGSSVGGLVSAKTYAESLMHGWRNAALAALALNSDLELDILVLKQKLRRAKRLCGLRCKPIRIR